MLVSNLAPMSSASEPLTDPALNDETPYCRYDEAGRIRQTGMMASGILLMLRIQGERYVVGRADPAIHWVDVSGEAPEIAERPVLELPGSLTAAVMEEAVLPGLPACRIAFTGPQEGFQDHDEAGDAFIGFMVPGTYTISADPFPAQAFTLTLEVTE